MSLNKDYLISFFLSLAFWISILFVFSLSLQAPKPKEPTILILKAPKLVQLNKPVVKTPVKPIQKPVQKPLKPSQKPLKTIKTPQEKPISSTPSKPLAETQAITKSTKTNLSALNLPSKAPPNVPSLPKSSSKPSNASDYFKNAYTPPKALYSPKPHIPQELLPNVKELTLKVKFYIKKDGSAKAKLLNPTPNPSLNAILQKELSNWKFFPATKAQKPINSTLDMEIKIKIE
jgi:outer membrane biosynthesis protein TonB